VIVTQTFEWNLGVTLSVGWRFFFRFRCLPAPLQDSNICLVHCLQSRKRRGFSVFEEDSRWQAERRIELVKRKPKYQLKPLLTAEKKWRLKRFKKASSYIWSFPQVLERLHFLWTLWVLGTWSGSSRCGQLKPNLENLLYGDTYEERRVLWKWEYFHLFLTWN